MNPFHLFALSIIGFSVSLYLYNSKINNKKIFCLMGRDCDEVVKSTYGQTFGIENTLIGIIYFVLIFIYGILSLNGNVFKGTLIYYFIVSASFASVLFSVYLTGVQAFVLKKWCDYCIVSSVTSLLILVVLLA